MSLRMPSVPVFLLPYQKNTIYQVASSFFWDVFIQLFLLAIFYFQGFLRRKE